MLKNKKGAILSLLVFSLLFLIGIGSVLAVEINYPALPGAAPPQEFSQTAPPEEHLVLYVLYIFNLIIWLSGVIVLGALIYAGFLYLTSLGNPSKIAEAKDRIVGAFFGILLLLSSFMILQFLGPQLTVVELEEIEPVQTFERPEIKPPPSRFRQSSINTELPWADIIENRLFSTSTREGIKLNAITTLTLARNLMQNSQRLQSLVRGCSCDQAQPLVCGGPCTSDPCELVRGQIERTQAENLRLLDELKAELYKSEEWIRFLRKELAKLERAEKVMKECPLAFLASLANFLTKKNFYINQKWLMLEVKFWDQIITIEDWADIFCPVSGTVWEGPSPLSEAELEQLEKIEESEEPQLSCPLEAPVGDIIDRAKRLGYKLVTRLWELGQQNRQLAQEIDKLHVLVSQCSSQVCTTICTSSRAYCGGDNGTSVPCPYTEIDRQVDKIIKTFDEIEKTVLEPGPGEKIGIIPMIDQLIVALLEDLRKEVRHTMQGCSAVTLTGPLAGEPAELLQDCQSVMGSDGPEGVIENCCLQEPEFQECLQECYLEEGQQNYRACLQGCLIDKSDELKRAGRTRESEIIRTCRNKINFYCCGSGEAPQPR